jgi:hypothetical protein
LTGYSVGFKSKRKEINILKSFERKEKGEQEDTDAWIDVQDDDLHEFS